MPHRQAAIVRETGGRGLADLPLRGPINRQDRFTTEVLTMDQSIVIQAAASVAGGMAATMYGKFGELEASRITEIAVIAVKIARAIEIEARKHP
jgi:hypothetical protein